MKNINTTFVVLLALTLVGSIAVQGAVYEQSVWDQDWNNAVWGSGPDAPSSGNNYRAIVEPGGTGNLLRMPAGNGASTFGGDNLELTSGVHGLIKSAYSTATISGALTLSGATLNHAPNGGSTSDYWANLDVQSFNVAADSTYNVGNAAGSMTISAPLSGTGDLYVAAEHTQTGDVLKFDGLSNFTGSIFLGDAHSGATVSNTGAMTADFGTTDYTFSDLFTINGTSVLNVNDTQTLTFNQGALSDPTNGTVAPGTYAASALGTNYTGTGTINVIPEPASLFLMFTAMIGVGLLRRKMHC